MNLRTWDNALSTQTPGWGDTWSYAERARDAESVDMGGKALAFVWAYAAWQDDGCRPIPFTGAPLHAIQATDRAFGSRRARGSSCVPWDPAQYLKFADERTRPAVDLLARVPLASPRTVYDLGAGAGNVTRMLRERWPEARITGVNASAEILARARAALPDVEWVQADLAGWRPPEPADVIFSNAALHWLGDHSRLWRSSSPPSAATTRTSRSAMSIITAWPLCRAPMPMCRSRES